MRPGPGWAEYMWACPRGHPMRSTSSTRALRLRRGLCRRLRRCVPDPLFYLGTILSLHRPPSFRSSTTESFHHRPPANHLPATLSSSAFPTRDPGPCVHHPGSSVMRRPAALRRGRAGPASSAGRTRAAAAAPSRRRPAGDSRRKIPRLYPRSRGYGLSRCST